MAAMNSSPAGPGPGPGPSSSSSSVPGGTGAGTGSTGQGQGGPSITYSLKWAHHRNNLAESLKEQFIKEEFVDVTLISAGGRKIHAHKLALISCSAYFYSAFHDHPCQHPIVILKDVEYEDLEAVIQFIYHGEVNVSRGRLASMISLATDLHIKGLDQTQIPSEPGQNRGGAGNPSSPMDNRQQQQQQQEEELPRKRLRKSYSAADTYHSTNGMMEGEGVDESLESGVGGLMSLCMSRSVDETGSAGNNADNNDVEFVSSKSNLLSKSRSLDITDHHGHGNLVSELGSAEDFSGDQRIGDSCFSFMKEYPDVQIEIVPESDDDCVEMHPDSDDNDNYVDKRVMVHYYEDIKEETLDTTTATTNTATTTGSIEVAGEVAGTSSSLFLQPSTPTSGSGQQSTTLSRTNQLKSQRRGRPLLSRQPPVRVEDRESEQESGCDSSYPASGIGGRSRSFEDYSRVQQQQQQQQPSTISTSKSVDISSSSNSSNNNNNNVEDVTTTGGVSVVVRSRHPSPSQSPVPIVTVSHSSPTPPSSPSHHQQHHQHQQQHNIRPIHIQIQSEENHSSNISFSHHHKHKHHNHSTSGSSHSQQQSISTRPNPSINEKMSIVSITPPTPTSTVPSGPSVSPPPNTSPSHLTVPDFNVISERHHSGTSVHNRGHLIKQHSSPQMPSSVYNNTLSTSTMTPLSAVGHISQGHHVIRRQYSQPNPTYHLTVPQQQQRLSETAHSHSHQLINLRQIVPTTSNNNNSNATSPPLTTTTAGTATTGGSVTITPLYHHKHFRSLSSQEHGGDSGIFSSSSSSIDSQEDPPNTSTTSTSAGITSSLSVDAVGSEGSSTSTSRGGLQQQRSIQQHCPSLRPGPALGCNYCWNSVDECGRILRRKTKYHCPDCNINLCIVPCFQEYHEKINKKKRSKAKLVGLPKPSSM